MQDAGKQHGGLVVHVGRADLADYAHAIEHLVPQGFSRPEVKEAPVGQVDRVRSGKQDPLPDEGRQGLKEPVGIHLRLDPFRDGRSQELVCQAEPQKHRALSPATSGSRFDDRAPVRLRLRPDQPCQVADPDQPVPAVNEAMLAENGQEVLRGQARHVRAQERQGLEAAPQPTVVNGGGEVERGDPPVQLDVGMALRVRQPVVPVQWEARLVLGCEPVRHQDGPGPLSVGPADQDVEVAKLADCRVAVGKGGQDGALERYGLDAVFLQKIENPKQFTRQE